MTIRCEKMNLASPIELNPHLAWRTACIYKVQPQLIAAATGDHRSPKTWDSLWDLELIGDEEPEEPEDPGRPVKGPSDYIWTFETR